MEYCIELYCYGITNYFTDQLWCPVFNSEHFIATVINQDENPKAFLIEFLLI